jgi:anhydro-N-acetylmuramic acid kinase
VKDFDLSFVRGLSLEDGAATLTKYTSEILCNLIQTCTGEDESVIISGGGRKNRFLVKNIQKKINSPVKLIDDLGVDGDFVESQAFAYLAIRSYLNLPISFPKTTGVREPCTGGVITNNF